MSSNFVSSGQESEILLDDNQPNVTWQNRIYTALRKCYSWRRMVKTLAIGQLLSFCVCGAGVASQALKRHHFDAPTTQSFLYYYLLAITYGALLAYKCSKEGAAGGILDILKRRGWKYLFVAFADVEGNYAMVLAYQYTSLTSVQLLDSFAIVGVMVLSWFVLKVRYRLIHYVGVVICVVGTVALVFADIKTSRASGQASNPALGDFLVLLGATLLSISNIAQEYFVKRFDWIEFVGMIGILGSFISGIQLIVIERHSLDNIDWSQDGTSVVLLMAGFAVSLFVFYSVTPYFMRISSALLFVLSILTADLYAFLFGLFVFNYKFSSIYCISFVVIAVGLIVYTWRPTDTRVNSTTGKQESQDIQQEQE